MSSIKPVIRFSRFEEGVRAAHDLFIERIGAHHVEDADGFRQSVCVETADWIPRLGLAFVARDTGGDAVRRPAASSAEPELSSGAWTLAAAQLGGLLPPIRMVSLPYTAVAAPFEGQGVYLTLKRAMLAELQSLAGARGLPAPLGNISEEAPGSAQYQRKVGRGIAIPFGFTYYQPAVSGLREISLALTFEALARPAPQFSPDDELQIVAAIYRGLYRIARPESHPTFQRIAASIRGPRSSPSGQPANLP